MRILHILDHSVPLHSGYSFRTLAILRQQRHLGWQTIHLTGPKQGSPEAEQDIDGWHFFRTPTVQRWYARLPVLGQLLLINNLTRRLHQIAKAERPQILHAHSPALNAVAALRVARQLKIPVLYEIRGFWEDAAANHGTSPEGGMRYLLTRALETYVLRHVDAATTICDGLRRDILARGIPGLDITVVPNAVDGESLYEPLRTNHALAGKLRLKGLILGFIGSFYAYEGLAFLLYAMPRLLAVLPSVQLLLVGGGPQDGELRALVKKLNLQDKVSFIGRVPQHEIAQYYKLIDILIYPRLPMRLTELVTPLKPLEAMAHGRMLIASDVGGHREMIEHGKTGMLFTAGDADALIGEVLYLVKHVELWPVLRQQARTYITRERSWTASVARYAAIYQRLLSSA